MNRRVVNLILTASLLPAIPALGQEAKPAATTAPAGALYLGSPALAASRNVTAAAFSPDGQRIAAASDDGDLDLWDAATGRRTARLGRLRAIADVAYSRDGARLYAASYDGEISVFDTAQPAKPPRVFATRKKVQRLAVSPDGKTIATGGDEICLWDAAGDSLGVLGSNGERTNSLSFSDDGATLVSAGFDKTVRVWDVARRAARRTINVGGESGFVFGAVAPDGKTIVTGGGSVRLRDAVSGKETARLTFATGGSTGGDVRFAPDGKLVAIDSVRAGGGGVIIYDVAAAKEVARLDAQYGGMLRFAWSADSKRLLVFAVGPRMQLWDVANARQLLAQPAHRRQVLAVAAAPDGQTVASGDAEGRVILWNALSGAARQIDKPGPHTRRTPFNHSAIGAVFDLAFAHDGDENGDGGGVLLVADAVGVTAWSLDTLATLATTPAANRSVWEIAVSGDGTRMAVGAGPGKASVVDRATGKPIAQIAVPPESRSFALDAVGKRLFVAANGPAVHVFDAERGQALEDCEVAEGRVSRVAASPDGRWVAGCGGARLYLWDTRGGAAQPAQPAQPATLETPAQRVAFAAGGELLAAADGKSLELWEPATARRIAALASHAADVRAFGFMPRGRRLVSGGDDATVIVWDLAHALVDEDRPKEFPRVRIDRLWRELDDADPAVAYRAVAALVRTPDDALALLGERMRDPAARGRYRAARADAVLAWIGTEQADTLRVRLGIASAARRPATGAASRPASRGAQPPPPATSRKADRVTKGPGFRYPLVEDAGTFRNMVAEGDWRVLPTVFTVVERVAERPPARPDSLTEQAIEAAGAFRLHALRPALLTIYRSARVDVPLRERAAVALAQLGDDADVAELTAALSGDVLGSDGRLLVAAALLPRDVDAARDVLIDGYKEYLAGMADGSHFALQRVREILITAADAKLIERVEVAVAEQRTRTGRNNVANLAETMRLESLPAGELAARAADNAWARANERYHAIAALGRRGGPEHVKVLQDLAPWPRGSGGDNAIQQRQVKEHAARAVADIRRRHWAHFSTREIGAKRS